ncbi:MAG: ATPase, partial [Gammaproteobacteria bacterium]|nr:ATPase [Gammaproteobacteria bacterium]
MFKPLPVKRIALQCLREDAALAALVLADAGLFNPETSKIHAEQLPEFPGESYREAYRSARSRLDKILSHCGTPALTAVGLADLQQVSEQEIKQLDEWLREVWRECSHSQEALRRIEEERKHVDQLLRSLDNFSALDIDLGLLAGPKRFVDVHIGTVPAANVERLGEAVTLAGYIARAFMHSGDHTHIIVAGPKGREEEMRPVLQAAGWRRVDIPPELHERPEKARRDLKARFDRLLEQINSQCRVMETTQKGFIDKLIAAQQLLRLAAPYAELGEALRGRGGLSFIGGWVPKQDLARMHERLRQRLGNRFVLTARDPLPKERALVPSVIRHPRLLQPFLSLVKNYGVPRYGEVDPTWLFAISFVAMFGMMFGDVGHGAVIAALAFTLRRMLGDFRWFALAAGLSSMLFGFFYGSIFGYEELLHPLWMSPLSDPTRMLTLALYWGIGFILIATALTVYNRLIDGRYAEALFDGKGLAGMLFYLGLLYGAYREVTASAFGAVEAAAIFIPFAVVLAYKWHHYHAAFGERVLVVFIEGFETVMSYLANTLSFLRVAAFSLNHVALAIAVFTLAGMMDFTGHWITVVLGNVFILVLEGGI